MLFGNIEKVRASFTPSDSASFCGLPDFPPSLEFVSRNNKRLFSTNANYSSQNSLNFERLQNSRSTSEKIGRSRILWSTPIIGRRQKIFCSKMLFMNAIIHFYSKCLWQVHSSKNTFNITSFHEHWDKLTK